MKDIKKIFGYEGSFITVTEKIFDIMFLSILWFLSCIPLLTIGAAVTALYYTVQKAKKNEGYLYREYWKAFRQNLKPSLIMWLVIGGLTQIFLLNIGIVRAKMSGNINIQIFFFVLYGLCLFFILGIQMYAFPALSRFDMPAGWILKLSIYLCFRHIGRTILVLGVTAMAFAFVYYCWPVILVIPYLTHCVYGYLIEPVLELHMPKTTQEG